MQESSDYCIFSACTMSSQRKFTFAISSPDEFLVLYGNDILVCSGALFYIILHLQCVQKKDTKMFFVISPI